MDALIESGRDLYARRNFAAALKQFTRAMHLCPCNRGMKRKRCSCKDYEAVAARDGSMFDEAMFTCECDVAKSFAKCDDSLHITALDYRAATFEAMHELDRAEKDAKWMLELAPRLPDGYLRLGKIARLRKNAWLAWKIYCAGADANKHTPLGSSGKLEQLHKVLQPLQMRFKRKDPMHFPIEIIHHILADFDVVELTKCLRVSKAWKRTLEGEHCRDLWRQLVFTRPPPQPPSNRALKALVQRSSRGVRRIVIKDLHKFQLTQTKLTTLLRHSQRLEHLELGPAYESYYRFPRGPDAYRKLRFLSMDTYNCWERRMWESAPPQSPGDDLFPADFIACAAASLEHLDLFAIPPRWCLREDLPEFPRLKTLRLEHKEGLVEQISFPIFHLAARSRQLEQLCLKNVHLDCDETWVWRDMWPTLWVKLEVLVFLMPKMGSNTQAADTLTSVTLLNSLNYGNTLRHLDLEVAQDNGDNPTRHLVLSSVYKQALEYFTGNDGMERVRQYEKLRSLRLKDFLHPPPDMKILLESAVQNGELHTFDIVFPVEELDIPRGRQCVDHLRGYDWLRGLESIRSLGVSRFRFAECPLGDDEMPLPGFLASFPNLETVCLSSEYYKEDEFCRLAVRVMKETTIKTLYQHSIKGTLMDRLVEQGEELGVDVLWGQRPRVWPVPPED